MELRRHCEEMVLLEMLFKRYRDMDGLGVFKKQESLHIDFPFHLLPLHMNCSIHTSYTLKIYMNDPNKVTI